MYENCFLCMAFKFCVRMVFKTKPNLNLKLCFDIVRILKDLPLKYSRTPVFSTSLGDPTDLLDTKVSSSILSETAAKRRTHAWTSGRRDEKGMEYCLRVQLETSGTCFLALSKVLHSNFLNF